MFENYTFLIVTLESHTDLKDVGKLQISIENNGGKTYVKSESDNDINYLEEYPIDHIITRSTSFIEFELAKESQTPITTPDWVYESINARKVLHPSKFDPDGRLFLKDCFVCIGDEISKDDKEILYGGVKAFGGMYLDDLTSYTTHLITTDPSSVKSILVKSSDLDIKTVTPNWLDDCLKMGQKLKESSYLLEPKDDVSQEIIVNDLNPDANNILPFDSHFFQNKSFFISNDYKLSKNVRSSISTFITKSGGKVASKYSDNIDIYIGKFRQGKEYNASFKSNRIIICNLQWLYYVTLNKKWVLPVNSLLLHYPIPPKPLPRFKGLKISVTNYSHNARYFLTKLICILGGTFTKNLTKENDFLIVGKPSGSKYEAAHDKWLEDGEPFVKVVNHLWLEDCFSKWKMLDYNKPKYQNLGYLSGEGTTRLVNKTKLDPEVLKTWVDYDIDDSMDDDLLNSPAQETDYSSEDEKHEDESDVIEEEPEIGWNNDLQNEDTPQPQASEAPSPVGSTAEKTESPIPVEEKSVAPQDTPQAYTPARGRSAKAKATMKLHNDMEDLKKHQELLKSSRKMTQYMKLLENEGKRSRSQDKENITPPKKKQAKTKEATPTAMFDVVAIMTGCEDVVDLNREDTQNLKTYGVKISTDLSRINCLIAPKILRTEKFLTSLSKVTMIIHPDFINDLKELISLGNTLAIDINNYRLDKVLLVHEINQQLGYTSDDINGIEQILVAPKGQLFNDYKLNLSANLNGGYEVLARILTSHGVSELKFVGKTASSHKNLLETGGKTIVVVHKTKDAKLMKSLKNCIFVEWDWCVKSIFKQQIQNLDEYIA